MTGASQAKPIPTRHLCLPAGEKLVHGVRHEWWGMLGHAGLCAARAGDDPVRAVHEFRKAIRRSRAMLRLLERILPRDVYQETRARLREVHRATSELRDRDVVLHTLDSLDLPAALAEPVRACIATAEPVSAERSAAVLAELAPRLPAMVNQVVGALPQKISRRAMRQAMARSYRRTRASMRAARRSSDDQALHEWRKRTKELRYQVELFIDHVGKRKARRLRARLSDMTELLGQIVDLLVLGEYVEQHLRGETRTPLARAIAKQRTRLDKQARRKGEKLFSRSPDEFARRVLRMNRQKRS